MVLRFAFNYGIWWIQEIVQLAILSAYFLGTSYIFKARQYLVIDLVHVGVSSNPYFMR